MDSATSARRQSRSLTCSTGKSRCDPLIPHCAALTVAAAAARATVAAARDLKRESGAEKPSRIRSGLG